MQGVVHTQPAWAQVACVVRLLHGVLGLPLHPIPSQAQPAAAQDVPSPNITHDRSAFATQTPTPAAGGVQPGGQEEQPFAAFAGSQLEQPTGVPVQRPGVVCSVQPGQEEHWLQDPQSIGFPGPLHPWTGVHPAHRVLPQLKSAQLAHVVVSVPVHRGGAVTSCGGGGTLSGTLQQT
jgi:hypothetical protein